ncbi:MAG: Putative outer membrane protein, partial [Proteiniphilum acetatigenes]
FLMENGRTIDDPQSGYVEEGFAEEPNQHWNPNNRNINIEEGRKQMISDIRKSDAWGHWKGDWNMYANREPRFYASILYNRRVIPQIPDDVNKRNYYNSPGQQDGFGRVELYYGGVSRQSGSYTFFSRTGYLAFKRVDPMDNMRDRVFNQDVIKIFIRYAEVLLNYIEALNEYDPGNPNIRKYWDMIRDRAGVPSVFVTNPEITGDKELQREFILRERQIELCIEGDRYFTTRRRWLSHTPDEGGPVDNRKYGDGGRMWGMDINAGDPASNNFSFTGFYKRVPFEERVFRKAYYLFPIPQTEIDKSENMVQNPWW